MTEVEVKTNLNNTRFEEGKLKEERGLLDYRNYREGLHYKLN